MKFQHITSLVVSLHTLFPLLTQPINALPIRYSILKPNKECLYTPVARGEFITGSMFIVDGTDLKAKVTIQGPIAPSKISSSAEVLAAALRYDKNGRDLVLNIDEVIDFETMYENDFGREEMMDDDDYYAHDDAFEEDDMDDALYEEYYYMDDDDEYEFMEDDTMDDAEIEKIRKAKAEREGMDQKQKEEMKKQKKEEKTKKFEEMKKKKEESRKKRIENKAAAQKRKALQKEKRMEREKDMAKKKQLISGEPYQQTFEISQEGWYRFCVASISDVIEVEMELRKSSEVGKPNTRTGHLQTYEHQEMIQTEKRLMKRMENNPTQSEESGIKVEDLSHTKNHVAKLTKLLYEIKEKQNNERNRLSAHKAVNEHSHSRMVLNSLFETIFYIAVSVFQVYTIRKWFSGAPILGY